MHVRLDTPHEGAQLAGGLVHVQGWAHDADSPVSNVVVLVDGRPLGRVGLTWPRPDVAAALGDPGIDLCGFDRLVTLPPSFRTPGRHTVQVRAVLLDGRWMCSNAVSVHLPEVPDRPDPEPFPRHRPRTAADGGPVHGVWLARSLDQGGSQLRMAETVEHLAATGRWTTTVLSPIEGPLRARLERAGADVQLIDPVPLDDPEAYRPALARLAAHLAGADLAVAPTVTSFPLAHAAVLAGVPAVQRIGESAPLPTVAAWVGSVLHPWVEAQAREAVAGAHLVWTNSHAVEEVYRRHGYDGRWRVLHTGRPRPRPAPPRDEARRLLELPRDRRLLVFAGTIWPIKGQGLLVEALRHVREEQPDLMLALVGHDGNPYTAALRDHLAAHGLTDRVRIAPFHDDLTTWWAAADAVALTPTEESEALSGALVEGMAHGLPALATRAGDAAVMVEEGYSGWLADADDLDSLVEALRRAGSADLDTWRTYGERAARRCEKEDDRETALTTVERLLREIAGFA